MGWFEWWFGVPAAVLLALGLWRALAPSRVSLNWQAFFSVLRLALRPTTVALLLISFAWVMTTAAGGVFDVNNTDWPFHRSIFLDLSDGDWPSEVLPDAITYLGVPSLLRHYLGYYMVPGLLGNWFGQAALNWAVPLWTWSGVALILLMFNRGRSGWKAVVAALILIFFSGMDALRIALVEGWGIFEFRLILEGWPRIEVGRDHLEWEGLRSIRIQFSSHMVGLMFVPKHFIAAALYTLLLLQLRRHMPFIAVSGVVLTAALFWSPFVAVGLLPFVAVFVAERGIRPFLRWQNILIPLPLAILLLVYLSSGSGDIPRGWFWDIHQGNFQEAIGALLSLYLSEFLILASLVLILQPRMRANPFFIASLALLLLFPLFSLGLFNDLVMRGVMPALFILCYYCADTLVGSSFDMETREGFLGLFVFALMIAVLAIGAITPLVELTRANNNHEFGMVRHEQLGDEFSIRGILEENYPEGYVPLYLTNEIPDWYLRLLGIDPNVQALAKGDLAIRSTYDVYFDGRTLVYIKDPCSQDEKGTYFFLQVVPLDTESLPKGHVHFNMDFAFTAKHALRKENICLAYRTLPDTFEVAYIKTGQLNSERTSHSWIAHYYSQDFTAIGCSQRPVSRSSVLNSPFTSNTKNWRPTGANRTDFVYCISNPRAARMTMARASSYIYFQIAQKIFPMSVRKQDTKNWTLASMTSAVDMTGTALQFVICRSMTSLKLEQGSGVLRATLCGKGDTLSTNGMEVTYPKVHVVRSLSLRLYWSNEATVT